LPDGHLAHWRAMEPARSSEVTLDDVRAARELLRGVILATPVQGSRPLSESVGGPVWLKCENLQRAGSFKIRGAYTRLSRLAPDEAARGVVAASAGNHAQGVALAAALLGIRTTVFMPEGAPIPKVEATRAYGAEVQFHGHSVDQALVAARAFSDETGAVFVHPFDHHDIVAGAGRCDMGAIIANRNRSCRRRTPLPSNTRCGCRAQDRWKRR